MSALDKKKQSVSLLLSRFRGWIQAAATLLTTLHLPNFFKGGIYQGKGTHVCVPGLNCYSCPAASGACPSGAFQAVVGSSKFRFSYYITGILILLGVLLGRFICGFLCPFGWLQELLHKIPGKKLSTKKLRPLTYLKYVILLLAVVLLLKKHLPFTLRRTDFRPTPQCRKVLDVGLPLAYVMSIQPNASLTMIGLSAPTSTVEGILLNIGFFLWRRRYENQTSA